LDMSRNYILVLFNLANLKYYIRSFDIFDLIMSYDILTLLCINKSLPFKVFNFDSYGYGCGFRFLRCGLSSYHVV